MHAICISSSRVPCRWLAQFLMTAWCTICICTLPRACFIMCRHGALSSALSSVFSSPVLICRMFFMIICLFMNLVSWLVRVGESASQNITCACTCTSATAALRLPHLSCTLAAPHTKRQIKTFCADSLPHTCSCPSVLLSLLLSLPLDLRCLQYRRSILYPVR